MANTAEIRRLNDAFRTTLTGGRVLITTGVQQLPASVQQDAIGRVRTFNAFTEDNDPYGEHDFGRFEESGNAFFWKIDYYDQSLRYGSEDPADPERTTRVLTLMLTSEY